MAISESDIPRWFDQKYAERGERYHRQDRVSALRKVDGQLRARCQGSQPSPYTVRVTLEVDEYVDSRCSCPTGGGCKHVAAVLHDYIGRSEQVPEEAAFSKRLRRPDAGRKTTRRPTSPARGDGLSASESPCTTAARSPTTWLHQSPSFRFARAGSSGGGTWLVSSPDAVLHP